MRNTTTCRKSLESGFSRQLRDTGLEAMAVCEVELGLYLLAQLDAQQSPLSLWPILTGYPFFVAQSETHQQMIFQARHLLHGFRSHYAWKTALEKYLRVKDSLRGYDVDLNEDHFSQREIALCRDRWNIYHAALTGHLPYHQTAAKWATAGSYRVKISNDLTIPVVLPDIPLFLVPPQKYLLGTARKRSPLEIRWNELVETAQWMDRTQAGKKLSPANWEYRLKRGGRLEVFDKAGELKPANKLIFNGIAHLAGMVSSGKSTLMDIVAVWAARHGLHITLVVSDVISAINRAAMFRQFDLKAAPILGADRRSHLNRLHQVLSAQQSESTLIQQHEGFRWLSTACLLNGLREDGGEPFEINSRPCRSLQSIITEETQKRHRKKKNTFALSSPSAPITKGSSIWSNQIYGLRLLPAWFTLVCRARSTLKAFALPNSFHNTATWWSLMRLIVCRCNWMKLSARRKFCSALEAAKAGSIILSDKSAFKQNSADAVMWPTFKLKCGAALSTPRKMRQMPSTGLSATKETSVNGYAVWNTSPTLPCLTPWLCHSQEKGGIRATALSSITCIARACNVNSTT